MTTTNPIGDLLVRLRAEPYPAKRAEIRAEIVQASHALMGERDAMRRRLIECDRWLTDNPSAPDFVDREDRWLGWLRDLMVVEDLLVSAREGMGP